MKYYKIVILFFVICITISCNLNIEDYRYLRIAFIPSENIEKVLKNTKPLIELLSNKLNLEVKPFVATDYTSIVEAFRANKLDIGFLSPVAYIMAKREAGVKVILKSHRNNSPYYYSAIVTRVDSGINELKDFKNKTFAFGDPLSTTGTIYPQKMFLENGINPNVDFKNVIYSGGHDATIMAIINKKVDGGATYCNNPDGQHCSWHQFLSEEEIKKIKVIKYSEPIPADNIVVSKYLNSELVNKIKNIFIEYSKDKDGQTLMRELYYIDGFMPASESDYIGIEEAFSITGID